MRIVIAPDSFKESLSARDVAKLIEAGLRQTFPDADFDRMPLGDGGEGTTDALLAATGGRRVRARVTGPLGEPVNACYGRLPDGRAVIDMAAASGLALVPVIRRNPLRTTSYGTGELVRKALDAGASSILLGIGGSATVDGGLGFGQALGLQFLDTRGRRLPAPLTGAGLRRVAAIDASGLDPRLAGRLRVACDVDNPLIGPCGAAPVFAPQKGASPAQVKALAEALDAYGRVLESWSGRALRRLPGAGAAGGLGALLAALPGVAVERGASLVLEAVGARARFAQAQLIVTGEGRLDAQTRHGKLPQEVYLLARQLDVPCVFVAGSVLFDVNVTKTPIPALACVASPQPLAEAMAEARSHVMAAAQRLGALLSAGMQMQAANRRPRLKARRPAAEA